MFDLCKGKHTLHNFIVYRQRAKHKSVSKNDDDTTSRVYIILDDAIWKSLCRHVPVSLYK